MEQRLWITISQTNEWVRYSDGKGVALLGIQGVLIGLALTFLKDFLTGSTLNAVSTVFLIVGIVCVTAAMVFTFLCLVPRLNNRGRKSPIYFGAIAASFKTPEEYGQYLREHFITEEDIIESLSEQIHTNSRIASVKFKRVSWSTRLTLSGLAFWSIFLIIVLLWG